MRLSNTISLLFLLAALVRPSVTIAADPDSLQARVTVTAMTYDDGFGVALKSPAGICSDPVAGEVFVADAGNGRVLVYDRQLNCIYSFRHYVTEKETGRAVLGSPKGLAVNREGEILIIDALTDRLELLDFRGRIIDGFRPNHLMGDTSLRLKASCLAVDDFDNFYVVVTGDVTRILVIDRDLRLVRQMGEKGDLPGQLNTPVAIAVHGGRIFVGDLYGIPAVKIFDTTGQFLSGFAGHDIERQDLTFPVGFSFLSDGSGGEFILVADGLRQTVKVYTATGEPFTMIGGVGYLPGLVKYPSGLASGGLTSFYVVERVGGRVQRYETK
jgi:DNA-binding beta-propeller fold protein YncE